MTDDPEGADVLASCRRAWRSFRPAMQERVHLVCLPIDDADENAIIINALQRHATVVAQKSPPGWLCAVTPDEAIDAEVAR